MTDEEYFKVCKEFNGGAPIKYDGGRINSVASSKIHYEKLENEHFVEKIISWANADFSLVEFKDVKYDLTWKEICAEDGFYEPEGYDDRLIFVPYCHHSPPGQPIYISGPFMVGAHVSAWENKKFRRVEVKISYEIQES